MPSGRGDARDEARESFYHPDCLFFPWGLETAQVTDVITGIDQKIPGWLMKIVFPGEFETAIGQVQN